MNESKNVDDARSRMVSVCVAADGVVAIEREESMQGKEKVEKERILS